MYACCTCVVAAHLTNPSHLNCPCTHNARLTHVVVTHHIRFPQQFLAERDALLNSIFANTPLMPGAERLVRHLAASGVPIAVATGSSRPSFELKTSKHRELFALFGAVVTGDQVPVAKPDPAIFKMAAERLNSHAPADPRDILVFEDAPNGVEAAAAAGMSCVMVPYPGMPPEVAAGVAGLAGQVLGSLEEFVPEEWGLQPYPTRDAEGGANRCCAEAERGG